MTLEQRLWENNQTIVVEGPELKRQRAIFELVAGTETVARLLGADDQTMKHLARAYASARKVRPT